jgi:hypothetical protein
MNEQKLTEAEQIAHTILYSPVTNGQHVASIAKGVKLIEQYVEKFKTRWIPVEEQWPEKCKVVLVFVRDSRPFMEDEKHILVAFLDYDNKFFIAGMRELKDVTHWQALPEAPKL